MVSYETVRRWVRYFGPTIAADLRRRRPKPHSTWHLDEVFIRINAGWSIYGAPSMPKVLDVVIQSKRDKRAALKLLRNLLKKMAFVPDKLVTDDLRSYGAAARELGLSRRHELSVHAATYNPFNVQRHLISAKTHRVVRA